MQLGFEKRKAVASMHETEVAPRQTLPGQVFVRMANVRRTIPVDFQTARGLSVDALKAYISEAHGQTGTQVTLCLHGRKVQSAELLKKELKVGDTIWLFSDRLLGGGKKRINDSDDEDDDFFHHTTTSKMAESLNPTTDMFTNEKLVEDIDQLRAQCQEKCERMKLFVKATDNDDQTWENFFQECQLEDCQRILAIGENGYADTLADKMDFFNKLPNEAKIRTVELLKEVLQKQEENELMSQVEPESPQMMRRKSSMELLIKRFPSISQRKSGVSKLITLASRQTSLATIGAVRQVVPNQSIIYQLPEDQGAENEQDIELRRPLSLDNEEDCEFISQIGELPKPADPLDYDYMQMSRLLSKQVLGELEKMDIFTSRYTRKLKKEITGVMFDTLMDIYSYDPNSKLPYHKEKLKAIRKRIIEIFQTPPTDNKFMDNNPKTFTKMVSFPEAQNAFKEQLLDKIFLEDYFLDWSKIISDPDTCKNMIRLTETFDKKTQCIFYRTLCEIMSRCDFLQDQVNYNPELLALREKLTITEVMLSKPVLNMSSKGDLQRFWMSDHPLLCYLQYNDDDQPKKLVMTHIADPEQPTKTFFLTDDEQFVQFVDQSQTRHSASIKVLIYDSSDKEMLIKTYRYRNPIRKKIFQDDVHWELDDIKRFPLSEALKKELRISTSEKQRGDTSMSDLSDELTDEDQQEKVIYQPRKVSHIVRKCKNDQGEDFFLQGLVIQTDETIFFYDLEEEQDDKKMTNLVRGAKVKLETHRGLQDNIYFVRKDSSGDTLHYIKVCVEDQKLQVLIEQINAPYNGEILSFEMDPLNSNDVESYFANNEILDEWQDKDDQIYIIDEGLNMYKLKVDRECEVLFHVNLSLKPTIKTHLENRLRGKDFVRLSMSERCISIFGKTYSLSTGNSWDFVYNSTADTQENQQRISWLESMPFSHLQIALLQQGDVSALCIKNEPSSRKRCTMDRRRRDVVLMKMLNEDSILTKLNGDGRSYWTLMDTLGHIHEIPEELKNILEKEDWTSLQVQELKEYEDIESSSSSSSSSSEEDEPQKKRMQRCIRKGFMVVLSKYDDPELRAKKTHQHLQKSKDSNQLANSFRRFGSTRFEDDIKQIDQIDDTNPLPNIAAIWLSQDGRKVLNTRMFRKEMLQEKLKLNLASKEYIISEGLYVKVMPSEEGRITMLLVDSLHIGVNIKSILFREENSFNEHEIVLDVWAINKTSKEHFKSNEEALMIGGVAYLKGPANKILRLRKMNPESNIVTRLDSNPITLPYQEDCILSKTSQFYRTNNIDAELVEKNLVFPEQLQISYADKVICCDVDQVPLMNDKESGYYEEYQGQKLMFDPERYVDSNHSAVKMTTEQSEDIHGEVVKIWTHLCANDSKDYYYVYQEWWWTNMCRPEHLGKKRDYSFLGFYRKYSEADLYELMRLKNQLRNQKYIKKVENEIFFCQFSGPTAFDIFFSDVQVLNILAETLQHGLQNEEDEDQNDVENSMLRRIYYQLSCHELNRAPRASCCKSITKKASKIADQNEPEKLSFKGLMQTLWEDGPSRFVKRLRQRGEEPEKFKKIDCNSTLYQILYSDLTKNRDLILKIANFCNDFTLAKIFISQDDIKAVLRTPTPEVVTSLDKILSETKYTKRILTLKTIRDVKLLTFKDDRFKLSPELCQEYVEHNIKFYKKLDVEDMLISSVTVRQMNLRWLTRNDMNFLDLVQILNETKNIAVLQTAFVSSLLEGFWDKYKKQIFYTQFIPFLCYQTAMISFMVCCLQDYEQLEGSFYYTLIYYPLLGLCWMFIINQLKAEFVQFKGRGQGIEYFLDYWNFNDMMYLILNSLVLFCNVADWPFGLPAQRGLAALSSLFLWFKVLDWLRLFDSTAFFISLMIDTIFSVQYFMIIMGVWYMTFGTAFYIINLNRNNNDLVPDISPFWAWDAFEVMYELGLGQFNTQPYMDSGHQGTMCYILFLFATFLIMIVFLNMLIAIMGDTFSQATQEKENNARITKLQIMGDYIKLINQDEKDDDKDKSPQNPAVSKPFNRRQTSIDPGQVAAVAAYAEANALNTGQEFLYVIIADEDTSDVTTWEGNLKAMQQITERAVETCRTDIANKIAGVNDRIILGEVKDGSSERALKTHLSKVSENVAGLQKSVSALEQKQNRQLAKIMKQLKAIKEKSGEREDD